MTRVAGATGGGLLLPVLAVLLLAWIASSVADPAGGTGPFVTFACGSGARNGTTRPTNNDTVCASCRATPPGPNPEAALQCTVYLQVLAPRGPAVEAGVRTCTPVYNDSLMDCAASFVFQHNDVPVIQFWAVDAAGTVGPPALLTWTVDSLIPVTIWPPFTFDTALTNSVESEVVVSCSRPGCRYLFSIDSEPLTAVGNSG